MRSLTVMLAVFFSSGLWAQDSRTNFPTVNELPVVEELPNPFAFFNSNKRVANVQDWEQRRKELKELFQHYVYGQLPPLETDATGEVVSTSTLYNGKATLYHAKVKMGPGGVINGNVRWIAPQGEGPFPLILYTTYSPSFEKMDFLENVIDRGFIVAEWYLYEYEKRDAKDVGQVEAAFPEYETGIVGQWAWSASACVDYFRKLPDVDPNKIILTGNSKRGKTTLLAGAFDDRISIVVPCCTGICGSGVFRFNEEKQGNHLEKYLKNPTPRALYSKHLVDFAGKEDRLPVDQHLLTALIAPRPVLTICGLKDNYDRNVAVQAGYRGAQPVFDWLGVSQNNGFRCHPQGHSYYEDDWYATLDFAELVWNDKSTEKEDQFKQLAFPPKGLFSWKAPATADQKSQ